MNEKINKTNPIPVKLGEKLKVKIIEQGKKGDGLSKYKGFIIITPNTETNKEYNIQITKIEKKFAFAKKQEEL